MGAASHRGLRALGPKTNPGIRCRAGRVDQRFGRNCGIPDRRGYAYRGDKDKAFEWLERARRQRDAGLGDLRKDPLLTNLYDDPRWNAFLRTMGLADDQLKVSAR